MGLTGEQVLGAARKYVAETMRGAGAIKGDTGKSAYQSALDTGFVGTEAEWIASLKGDKGESGKSVITRKILSAGETEITIEYDNITEDSILSFYTSIYGVNPISVVVNEGSVTLTFEVQHTDMEVGVRVDG